MAIELPWIQLCSSVPANLGPTLPGSIKDHKVVALLEWLVPEPLSSLDDKPNDDVQQVVRTGQPILLYWPPHHNPANPGRIGFRALLFPLSPSVLGSVSLTDRGQPLRRAL